MASGLSIAAAREREWATPKPGESYGFHSCGSDLAERSGERVEVIRPLAVPSEADPEVEPLYMVRFPDGHEESAYEGELNGWYLETGQALGPCEEDESR